MTNKCENLNCDCNGKCKACKCDAKQEEVEKGIDKEKEVPANEGYDWEW